MAVVVDASSVGAILLPEQRPHLARIAAGIWREDVHVPVHWPIEVVSLIVKAERGARLTIDEAQRSWDMAGPMLSVAHVESTTDPSTLWGLVHQYHVSAQDAAYLDLAIKLGLPLLTGDKQLARACIAAAVPLPFDPNP